MVMRCMTTHELGVVAPPTLVPSLRPMCSSPVRELAAESSLPPVRRLWTVEQRLGSWREVQQRFFDDGVRVQRSIVCNFCCYLSSPSFILLHSELAPLDCPHQTGHSERHPARRVFAEAGGADSGGRAAVTGMICDSRRLDLQMTDCLQWCCKELWAGVACSMQVVLRASGDSAPGSSPQSRPTCARP